MKARKQQGGDPDVARRNVLRGEILHRSSSLALLRKTGGDSRVLRQELSALRQEDDVLRRRIAARRF